MNLEDLRREHDKLGIGPLLFDLLFRIARSSARRYPARAYTDDHDWTSEALEDVFQGWVADSLTRRKELSAIMKTASTVGRLRAMLTTSFHHFMVNQRKKSSAANLYDNARRLLATDPDFEAVSTGRRADAWTLAREPKRELAQASPQDLLAAAWDLKDEELKVVRYGPESKYVSPILRQPALKTFLEHLLRRADGAVEMSTIDSVVRHRFNLNELLPRDLPEWVASRESSPARQVEVSEQAESARRRLGEHLCMVLRGYAESRDDTVAAANALNVSVAQFRRQLGAARRIIGEYADSEEEAIDVYRQVVDSLF